MVASSIILLAGVCFTGAGDEKHARAIDVKIIKYDGLKEAVRKNRGKVVLVCFWADCNPPSIVNLSRLVALQQKYGDKGLETITVEVGVRATEETPQKQKAWILNRLTRMKVNVPNFILDEEPDFVVERLGTFAPYCCAFVFNRQGKWVRFSAAVSESRVDPMAIEKLVAKFLQEK